jgi:hypothetical protein
VRGGEYSRLLRLLAARGFAGLAPRLVDRAARFTFMAHPGVLRRLAADDDVVPSGVSAAATNEFDLVAGDEVEGYIRASRLAQVRSRFALSETDGQPGNVTLRVVPDDAWHLDTGDAPLTAVALDLAAEADPRSARIGGAALRQLDDERRWTAFVRPRGSAAKRVGVGQRLARGEQQHVSPTRRVRDPAVRDGETIDVLGPDGMKGMPPQTVLGYQTIQVPGGTQALTRTEPVDVRVGGDRTGFVRSPTLAAALLLKVRALCATSLRDQDRADVVLLLACVEDPILIRELMTNTERGWLRKGAKRLRIDEDDLADLFTSDQLARARAAYSLITAK